MKKLNHQINQTLTVRIAMRPRPSQHHALLSLPLQHLPGIHLVYRCFYAARMAHDHRQHNPPTSFPSRQSWPKVQVCLPVSRCSRRDVHRDSFVHVLLPIIKARCRTEPLQQSALFPARNDKDIPGPPALEISTTYWPVLLATPYQG